VREEGSASASLREGGLLQRRLLQCEEDESTERRLRHEMRELEEGR
jgi:hypothetical protein